MKIPPTQTATEEQTRLLTKLGAVFRSLLTKKDRYIAILYIPGGPTGMQTRCISNIGNSEHLVQCLQEAIVAVQNVPVGGILTDKDFDKINS